MEDLLEDQVGGWFLEKLPLQSPDWLTHLVKQYGAGTLFVLDYDEQAAAQPGRTRDQQIHDSRCAKLTTFFRSRTPYEVEAIPFPRGSTLQDWQNAVRNMKAGKTADDLIMIFYDGKAFGIGENWTFKFENNLRPNALDFIRSMNQSNSDIFMRLQCPHNSRMWIPRKNAMTEISFGSLGHYDGSGRLMDDDGDWVNSFVRIMESFLEDPKSFVARQMFWNYKMKTPAEMMRWDLSVNDNVDRNWSHKPSRKSQKVIRRLVIDPALFARTGTFEFFGKQIQPKPSSTLDEEEEEVVDEGIGMEDATDSLIVEDEGGIFVRQHSTGRSSDGASAGDDRSDGDHSESWELQTPDDSDLEMRAI